MTLAGLSPPAPLTAAHDLDPLVRSQPRHQREAGGNHRVLQWQVKLVELFEDSLRSSEPMWELRGVLRSLLALGCDRGELRKELLDFLDDLRATGRGKHEDVVHEVALHLERWSSPHLKL